MVTWRLAALLLLIDTIVLVTRIVDGNSPGADWPSWAPVVWFFNDAARLVVAVGLWLGHRWAWWIGVVMCSVQLLLGLLASVFLALGVLSVREGAFQVGLLLAIWLVALALLIFAGGSFVPGNWITTLRPRVNRTRFLWTPSGLR